MSEANRQICGNCGEGVDECIAACPGLPEYERRILEAAEAAIDGWNPKIVLHVGDRSMDYEIDASFLKKMMQREVERRVADLKATPIPLSMTVVDPSPQPNETFQRLMQELQRLQDPGTIRTISWQTVVEPVPLGLDDYQQQSRTTAVYPGVADDQLLYPLLGLMGEVGEVADKLFESISDTYGRYSHPVVMLVAMITYLGEAAQIFKKAWRDNGGEIPTEKSLKLRDALENLRDDATKLQVNGPVDLRPLREALPEGFSAELGGVLWYLAALASEANLTLGAVGSQNLEKLASRQQRGVIQGDGDDR